MVILFDIVEILIVIGLFFILLLAGFLHFLTTTNSDAVRQIVGGEPNKDAHFLFMLIEGILILTMYYVCFHAFS